MKQFVSTIASFAALLLLPVAASAQSLADGDGNAGEVGNFLGNVLGFIDSVLLPLILGLAFLMFVWGVFKFFILGGSDEEQQTKGRSLMIYAVAGFVLILAFYGIVNVITDGLGLGGDTVNAPGVPEQIN